VAGEGPGVAPVIVPLNYSGGISTQCHNMTPAELQSRAFLLLLTLVTIAFAAILWQFHGAVFWGVILAILFTPLHRKLLARMPGRVNLAALCTLGFASSW
jgi:predicted PurR-regulated permease PerM